MHKATHAPLLVLVLAAHGMGGPGVGAGPAAG